MGKTIKKNPNTYLGSGKYWRSHLKKHGANISTIWCHLFTNEENMINFALYFSSINDITNSKEWANLKPENGKDGGGHRILQRNTPESIAKGVETRRRNDSYKTSPETKAKSRNTKEKNGSLKPNMSEKIICEHCSKAIGKFNYYKWHHNNCKTIKSFDTLGCIFCKNDIVKNNFSIWHGENCKLNPDNSGYETHKNKVIKVGTEHHYFGKKPSIANRKINSNKFKNSKWIKNESQNQELFVHISLLEEYFKNKWTLGRIYKRRKSKISNSSTK